MEQNSVKLESQISVSSIYYCTSKSENLKLNKLWSQRRLLTWMKNSLTNHLSMSHVKHLYEIHVHVDVIFLLTFLFYNCESFEIRCFQN